MGVVLFPGGVFDQVHAWFAGIAAARSGRYRPEKVALLAGNSVFDVAAVGSFRASNGVGAKHRPASHLAHIPVPGGACGGGGMGADPRQSPLGIRVIPLVACHASSSLRAFPNYLSYANEAWGGPANTYKYLTDSNVDWGQQLKTVHAYLDQRHQELLVCIFRERSRRHELLRRALQDAADHQFALRGGRWTCRLRLMVRCSLAPACCEDTSSVPES